MEKLRTLVLFASLFMITEGEASPCTKEFSQFKDCMTEAFDNLVHKSDVENKIGQIQQCFVKGNCNVSDEAFSFAGHSHGKGGGQCKKQIFEQLGGHIENCVKSKVPGFTFADLFVKKAPGTQGLFHIPSGGRKLGRFLRMLRNPDTCPSDKRDEVHGCLTPIIESAKGAMKQYVNELCSAKDKCLVSMTPKCKEEFNNVKKDVVACTCDHLEPNAAKYTQEFLTCIGRNEQPNPLVQKMIEQFIPRFCQKMRSNPDVCQNLQGLVGGHRLHG